MYGLWYSQLHYINEGMGECFSGYKTLNKGMSVVFRS